MTFITHRFWVSVVSDVRERVQDLGSPLRFMLRRSSLVEECVSVLHGTCLQCAEFFFIHQYVQPCLSKNPKYTFYTIKSSLTLAYCNMKNYDAILLSKYDSAEKKILNYAYRICVEKWSRSV